MRFLSGIFSRRRRYSELAQSIQEHLAERIDELMSDGLTRVQAEQAAKHEFGNVVLIEQRSREVWQWRAFENIHADARFALRQMARAPGFVITVCVTLALGIGVNTAIFSIVNALLLKQLPYPHPERIVTLFLRTTGSEPSDGQRWVDGEQWELLRDDVPSAIAALTAIGTTGVNVETSTHAQYVHAGRVSALYFDVLGLRPAMGREFNLDEDRPHGPGAAILSYSLWRTVFGGNRDAIGQKMLLRGAPYTIVGVLPEGATTPMNAELYIPLQPSRDGEGMSTNYEAILRLRDGATWQQANGEVDRALSRSQRAQDAAKTNPGGQLTYYLVPLQKGETVRLRPQVLALMLAAGFILLIACANLAGLTLVRTLRRAPEIATRLAVGATHWRVQRQLWIENLLLALMGGSCGIGVAALALRGLLQLLPEHFLPVAGVPLDGRVLAFTLVVSLSTSVLFGMLPALASGRVEIRSSLASRALVSAGSIRLRQALIAGEIALTVVLLLGAGLLIRTLIHLETMPPGFNPQGVMTAKASVDDARYHDPAALGKLLRESVGVMRQIPGVENAAVGLTLPYEHALLSSVTLSDGKEAGLQGMSRWVFVTPGYFETLEIPLLAGRTINDGDNAQAQRVAIVDETFVRKFYHGVNPVGRTMNKDLTIVGVVSDTVLSTAGGLNAEAGPLTDQETVYVPYAQKVDPKELAVIHAWFQPSWIVRTARPVGGLTAQMQRALESAAPNLPFSGFYSMDMLQAQTLAMQRVQVALLATMAALALLLSAVGIFALVANLVTQRTREIGLRIALGSTVRRAMVHAGSSGGFAAGIGLVMGLIAGAAAVRAIRSQLWGVGVYDAPTMLTVTAVLCAVALLAAIVPALRIARIDPAKTLREE
ncbi:MAG TPA: ABC transporter permease [Terracidiphilus sp.]|nr:ABC transporter permease [Terracidiphilus sp.]